MSTFPVIPSAGVEAGEKVNCGASYDAFNQMQTAQAGTNDNWQYRYDALGRRLLEWKDDTDPFQGTRFIYDGYSVIMERKFTSYVLEGTEEIVFPSTSDAHSKAHKIFVRGSLLFSAVDGDLDGYLGADNGEDLTTLNLPEYVEDPEGEEAAYETAVAPETRQDFAYYYLDNARGQVMALVARDAQEDVFPPESEGVTKARILEYYRYNAFGSVTVLPVYDRNDSSYSNVHSGGFYSHTSDDIPGSGSRSDWDLIENTPLDLSDNNTLMHNRRTGSNNHAANAPARRRS